VIRLRGWTAVLALTLIVVSAGGCGGSNSRGSKLRSTPHLDVALADFPDVVLGSRVVITGGSSEGDVGTIALFADSYPYGRFRRVADTHLDRNGTFEFTVRPDRNTRYRVDTPKAPAAAGGKVLAVYVNPRIKLTPFLVAPGRAQLVVVARLHRGARPVRARVYFYHRRKSAKRYRLLGSSLVASAGHDKARAVFEFSVPQPRHGDQNIACTREGYARDMGRAASRIAACGKSAIRSPQYAFRANQ
jgi:hypothetical protein